MLQLSSGSGGGQGLIEYGSEGHNALRSVESGNHPGWDTAPSIPRPQGGTRHPGGAYGFFEGDPAFFYGLVRQLAQHEVPIQTRRVFCGSIHPVTTTVSTLSGVIPYSSIRSRTPSAAR